MQSLDAEIQKLRRIVGFAPEKKVIAKAHEKIKKRIFVDGLDGLNRQIGAYSDRYDALRASRGLTTGRVVLHFTGQMMENFVLIESSNGYVSGFKDIEASQKALWNVNRYSDAIFEVSDDEQKFIQDELNKEIQRLLR